MSIKAFSSCSTVTKSGKVVAHPFSLNVTVIIYSPGKAATGSRDVGSRSPPSPSTHVHSISFV